MKITCFLLLLLMSPSCFSQQAFRFEDAARHNVRVSQLDSTYQSAIHSDSSKGVFRDQDKFAGAYRQLLQDLGSFLRSNGFTWQEKTAAFNRVYFEPSGKIDYFLYTFRTEMAPDKAAAFEALLNEFVRTYRLSLSAPVKFAQCSPVTYVPDTE